MVVKKLKQNWLPNSKGQSRSIHTLGGNKNLLVHLEMACLLTS